MELMMRLTGFVSFCSIGAFSLSANNAPNIILIMADDLGIGDLSCYGQKMFTTPVIDNLAKQGIVFTQHYAGCTVSAPSRCVLLTGKHTGHSFIRGNKGVVDNQKRKFDYPLASSEITLAELLKSREYVTACVGKWGLGGPGTEGHPNNQGFDYFFGYLGQANAHSYYPRFLFENNTEITLGNKVYSHDLIMDKACEFIRKQSDAPFFLYLTPTIPHADLIVPNNDLGEYEGKYDEKPYSGGGYRAQSKPRATFASMVTRLDAGIGQIIRLLEEKQILDNTIIIFTSDNGTHREGGHDPDYFDSNGPYRGYKRDLYEGGIRTPLIVQWPQRIKSGDVSYHVSASWDILPTICDLLEIKTPQDIDGISLLPSLVHQGRQKEHDYLYWEFHEQNGKQAILCQNWKLIKFHRLKMGTNCFELYNLSSDPSEQFNVAELYPEILRKLSRKMDTAHTKSILFPFKNEN